MHEWGRLKILIFTILYSPFIYATEFSTITSRLQGILLGAYNTNIQRIGVEHEGSQLDSELMFDVFVPQGEKRFCLYLREEVIRLFKASENKNCLGEVLFEFPIKDNWSWVYQPMGYLGKDVMGLRLTNKKNNNFYDIKFPNIAPKLNTKYERWDSPKSKFPFGFSISSNELEFD